MESYGNPGQNDRCPQRAQRIPAKDHFLSLFRLLRKAEVSEALKLPRLWMVDPRYDNVEVYHGGQYGLVLKEILALREILTEPLLPAFQYTVADLFKM